jgi:DNA repair exonuclease SbcCD ATPase subunit
VTRIKRLYLRNWLKCREADLLFPERGLVLVTGSNLAAEGKFTSIGSGKTALGEAVCRAVLGVPGRYNSLKSFSRDRRGDTYVSVELEHQGKPLLIETGYRCKELSATSEGLRFHWEGQAIERSRMQETREELVALLAVKPEVAAWTVSIDGSRLNVGSLSQRNAVDLLMMSLNQPPWTDYHARARLAFNDSKRLLDTATAKYEQARERSTDALASLDEAKKVIEEEETAYEGAVAVHKEKIEGLQIKIRNWKSELEALTKKRKLQADRIRVLVESTAEQHKALEIQQHDLDEAIQAAQDEVTRTASNRAARHAEAQMSDQELRRVLQQPDKCPVCKQDWRRDDALLASLKQKIQQKLVILEASETAQDAAKEKLADLRRQQENLKTKFAALRAKGDVRKLSEDYELMENEMDGLRLQIEKTGTEIAKAREPDQSRLQAARARKEEREKVLQVAQEKVAALNEEVVETRAGWQVVDYWTRAFSPAGIPNLILQDALVPLNSAARRVSAALTGQTIDLRFDTSRTLASGDEKAELTINVTNTLGSQDLDGNSKGESGLANFIVAEALAEVGQTARRIAFRWYDEVVPNQDATVCKSIYTYLRELAQRANLLIFLVDHNPDAANYADFFLNAAKDRAGTTYAWRAA